MQIVACHIAHFSFEILDIFTVVRVLLRRRHFDSRWLPTITETNLEAVSAGWRDLTEYLCFASTFIKNNFKHICDKEELKTNQCHIIYAFAIYVDQK